MANAVRSQADLARHQANTAREIEGAILRRVEHGDFSQHIEELLKNGELPEFEREIQGQFPFLRGFSLRVKSARLPDFVLYRQARSLYEAFLGLQKEYISGALPEKAEGRIDFLMRLDELEQYGALFTQYPVLLEYLALIESSRR